MKYNITIKYKQKYLPNRRCKNPRERVLVCGGGEVTVKETKKEEFPVAFYVTDFALMRKGVRTEAEGEEQKDEYLLRRYEIRAFEGRLYKLKYYQYGAALSDIAFPASELYGMDIIPYCHAISPDESPQDIPYTEGKSVVLYDGFGDAVERVQEYVDKYLLCGNEVWELTAEPIYRVYEFGHGGGVTLFIEWNFEQYAAGYDSKELFNAFQRPEAIAYGTDVAAANDSEFKPFVDIEVVMPEMVKFTSSFRRGLKKDDPYFLKLEEMSQAEHLFGGKAAAYLAWRNSLARGETMLDIRGSLLEFEVGEFIQTLREAKVDTFVCTNTSSMLMQNMHWFKAAGCRFVDFCTVTCMYPERGDEGTEEVLGVLFSLNPSET